MSNGRTLCLGEVLVDLICERPVATLADADAFVPHFGGATANVAVSAARHGAGVGLAGAVGDDPWGAWLRRRLEQEEVDVSWVKTLEGIATPLACIAVGADGEPMFNIYGEALAPAFEALRDDIDVAIAEFDGLFFGSNTLVGETERAVTERAHQAALRSGRPVIIDANLRLERWNDPREAAEVVARCIPGARLVRANRHEAEVLTGCGDPHQAADALLGMGADAAVVTLGRDGAVLAGPVRCHQPGVRGRAVSTVGAGDAFTGVLVAALTTSSYAVDALADALAVAVEAGARATERWGALEPRPPAHVP